MSGAHKAKEHVTTCSNCCQIPQTLDLPNMDALSKYKQVNNRWAHITFHIRFDKGWNRAYIGVACSLALWAPGDVYHEKFSYHIS